MTFYELIVNKARGKSGPLFDFEVREDVRITNDATKEKKDSHAGKVDPLLPTHTHTHTNAHGQTGSHTHTRLPGTPAWTIYISC
jgi:protein FAM50